MEQESKYYCQVLYPIQISIPELYEFGDITEEEYNGMIEDSKAELIYQYADYILTSSGIQPLIVECIDEELND
jgi:hypothetical protein